MVVEMSSWPAMSATTLMATPTATMCCLIGYKLIKIRCFKLADSYIDPSALARFIAFTPAFANQDGRRRVTIRYGFNIHGIYILLTEKTDLDISKLAFAYTTNELFETMEVNFFGTHELINVMLILA